MDLANAVVEDAPPIDLVIAGDKVQEIDGGREFIVENVSYRETWDGFEVDLIDCRVIGAHGEAGDATPETFKPLQLKRI